MPISELEHSLVRLTPGYWFSLLQQHVNPQWSNAVKEFRSNLVFLRQSFVYRIASLVILSLMIFSLIAQEKKFPWTWNKGFLWSIKVEKIYFQKVFFQNFFFSHIFFLKKIKDFSTIKNPTKLLRSGDNPIKVTWS